MQKQTRTCVDGTTDKCTAEDIEQTISCTEAETVLPNCAKKFGAWMNDGACVATAGGDCGPGTQMQTRTCTDGTVDLCTPGETMQTVSCADAGTALPNCPKVLGEWMNDGACMGTGADPTCGEGTQDQTRTCEDGTLDKCTAGDKMQKISCDVAGTALPDCGKLW